MEKRIERLGYSVTEAATSIGVSKPTIYKLMANGQLKYFQVGDRRIVSAKSLRELACEEE